MSHSFSGQEVTLRGTVLRDGRPRGKTHVVALGLETGSNQWIWAEPLGDAHTAAAVGPSPGRFEIDVPSNRMASLLGADGVAYVHFLAYGGDDLVGTATVRITPENVESVDVTISLGRSGDGATRRTRGARRSRARDGVSDELFGEVVDAISSIGGRPAASATRGAGAGAGLDRLFDDAVYRVLGARVRPDRPRDLETAFDRVFVEKEVDGRSEIEYRGTSGTATLPVEPRSVSSGAQAVIYRRALSQLVPVRQALRELAADDENKQDEFEAVRDVVDGKLGELVTALGRELRPPVTRIDGIFKQLLGPSGNDGYLAQLGTLVGFDDGDITLDEDRATTRFLEVELFVIELDASWQKLRAQIQQPSGPGSLRNRLDILALQLDQIAETTADLDEALTAADVDEAEREFIEIQASPPASLAELIAWLNEFAVGGKAFDSSTGISVVQETAGQILVLVEAALARADDDDAPAALRKTKVERALLDLARILDEIVGPPPANGGNGSGAGQQAKAASASGVR